MYSLQSSKILEALCTYVAYRPCMFLAWLQNDQFMQTNNVNAAFFITQSLFLTWKTIQGGHPDGKRSNPHEILFFLFKFYVRYFFGDALAENLNRKNNISWKTCGNLAENLNNLCVARGVYAHGTTETDRYETMIKTTAFEVMLAQHDTLKKNYEKLAMQNNTIQTLAALKIVHLHMQLFPPFQHFQQALSQLSDPKYQLLLDFVQQRDRLVVMRYLPVLVYFYRWIHETFAFMYGRDEAFNITIKDAITLLPDTFPMNAKTRLRLYEDFKQYWNRIRAELGQFQICRRAQQQEGDIIAIDDKTSLKTILTCTGGKKISYN